MCYLLRIQQIPCEYYLQYCHSSPTRLFLTQKMKKSLILLIRLTWWTCPRSNSPQKVFSDVFRSCHGRWHTSAICFRDCDLRNRRRRQSCCCHCSCCCSAGAIILMFFQCFLIYVTYLRGKMGYYCRFYLYYTNYLAFLRPESKYLLYLNATGSTVLRGNL